MLDLGGLFPASVITRMTDPRAEHAGLFAQERAFIASAVPKRQREFAAGRYCARDAMAALGLLPVAIPAAPDRQPMWPDAIAGSITHCDTICIAAVARKSDGAAAIGIDIEPAVAMDPDLWASICTHEELLGIEQHPAAERGLVATAIFAAKECAYKCQFPLTGMMLDFQHIHIDLHPGPDPTTATFSARFRLAAPPFRQGDVITGTILHRDGYIVAGAVVEG